MNYLTMEQIKEQFGLSEKQVRALFYAEDFPVLRIGNHKLVREDMLNNWVEKHIGDENAVKLDYTKV